MTLLSPDELRPDTAARALGCAARIAGRADGWWLHVDLDVLAEREFTAKGVPGEPYMPNGLSWEELTDLVSAALGVGGCRGWSLVIYDPDLDPDGSAAGRIVRFVRDVTPHLP